MPFPPQVREDSLAASGRHCCLCHKFCGIKIELHHIEQKFEGGLDTFDNCIPLCFDCHADMRSYDHKHPKGTKYTLQELRRHRDNWYAKVSASPSPTYDQASLELDKAVFAEISKLLPYPTVMRFIESHDFGGSFPASIFSTLDRFALANQDPSHEFIDADLEGMRVRLDAGVHEFAYYLACNTWPLGKDMQSVPSEWSDTQPRRWQEVVGRLNEMGTNVATEYRALVREARRRLGVSNDSKAS